MASVRRPSSENVPRAAHQPPPSGAEFIKPHCTPLGICRACATIVYAGDTLAMAGGYLLHGDCCVATPVADGA